MLFRRVVIGVVLWISKSIKVLLSSGVLSKASYPQKNFFFFTKHLSRVFYWPSSKFTLIRYYLLIQYKISYICVCVRIQPLLAIYKNRFPITHLITFTVMIIEILSHNCRNVTFVDELLTLLNKRLIYQIQKLYMSSHCRCLKQVGEIRKEQFQWYILCIVYICRYLG